MPQNAIAAFFPGAGFLVKLSMVLFGGFYKPPMNTNADGVEPISVF